MNDAELETQAHYIRFLAEQMRLRDWDFEVGYEKSQESPATIEVYPQRSEARIVLGGSFEELSVEAQRYCIVHELLHAILQPMRDCVETLQPMLAHSWPLIRSHHDNDIDAAGHKLASIIAPSLPSYDRWHAAQLEADRPEQRDHDRVPEQKRSRSRSIPAPLRRRAV